MNGEVREPKTNQRITDTISCYSSVPGPLSVLFSCLNRESKHLCFSWMFLLRVIQKNESEREREESKRLAKA